ncbi:cysteine desulfurase family protein [Rhodohalobacter sp. 8-1]|uniref:cysteine desulfurase family protein n=1 Tax=Rhodohalobacter sp. 8-1 TaxID=3131972 RepID=UPI0030EE6AB6
MIYLDYAATTPMSSTAIDAYQLAAEKFFANSNSLHDEGSNASGALEGSRKLLASIIGVSPTGLHFTGSGSEAAFLAIYGLVMANREKGRHIITSRAEHSCIRNSFNWLKEHHGFEVSFISSTGNGVINMDELENEIRPDTVLVSVQHVNSETGAINPLSEIGERLCNHPAAFHSDCVQSFCKLGVSPAEWGLDAISLSAHKIHGPKGLGAAYIHPRVRWTPFIPETNQEHGFRPGTVDVPAVVSFAAAARELDQQREENLEHVHRLKQRFITQLRSHCGDAARFEGDPEQSSPYICGLRVQGMEGQFAMLQCSQKGVGISTGSACQINEQQPSATMLAMGYEPEEAKQFIRISFDPATTADEVNKAAEVLADVLKSHLEHVKL